VILRPGTKVPKNGAKCSLLGTRGIKQIEDDRIQKTDFIYDGVDQFNRRLGQEGKMAGATTTSQSRKRVPADQIKAFFDERIDRMNPLELAAFERKSKRVMKASTRRVPKISAAPERAGSTLKASRA
jgi:hypothetical protein